MIYLDNAATTKPLPDVVNAMIPFIEGRYANPGSMHLFGQTAAKAIELAREAVASFLGCYPEQIVFTSGGSEANSLVFQGLRVHLKAAGKTHILVSAVEHDSVRKAALALKDDGFDVEFIPVNEYGSVEVAVMESMMRPNTGLISVMYMNNETGSVNPVDRIGDVCRRHNVFFHTDCVQAAGSLSIDVSKIGCHFASLSSHKLHSVKGSGALFISDLSTIRPLISGGSEQEFGLRGGTENVPAIVAFGEACRISMNNCGADHLRVFDLKERFYIDLKHHLGVKGLTNILSVNGQVFYSQNKILSLRFEDVDGESLLLMLSVAGDGVCVSAGSACRSHEVEPSHVLTAMGLTAEQARSTIRVSFSKLNTMDEVIKAAEIMADCVERLYYSGVGHE